MNRANETKTDLIYTSVCCLIAQRKRESDKMTEQLFIELSLIYSRSNKPTRKKNSCANIVLCAQ